MIFTIFANGEVNLSTVRLPNPTKIIAADGGTQHCLSLGIKPDVLIGDLDSIPPKSLASLEAAGVEIIRYLESKDETDLELAINYAVEHEAKNIQLYGLLGGRWDMSFANVMLLSSPKYSTVAFQVVADNLEIFILRGGQSIKLIGNPSDPVSVLPLGGNAKGVTYTGLAWSLKKANLVSGSPLGVSNHMLTDKATIQLASGILLIFHGLKKTEMDEERGISENPKKLH